MEPLSPVRRVIIVVVDGLRPDAIDAFALANMQSLVHSGAASLAAQTVSPSLTWPAITSLLTGLQPETHGILADSVHLPRPRTRLRPLPEFLGLHGYPSSAFMGAIPTLYHGIAGRVARGLGFAEARFAGASAAEVMGTARSTLRAQRRGLIFVHLADADRAGHAHGWMSDAYADAARNADAALGMLLAETRAHADPHTLLVALADHGGGGVRRDHHEEPHPLNATIPVVIAGGTITRCTLADARLIDVPPTVLWSLGIHPPRDYAGRALSEAFDTRAHVVPRQPAA